MGAAHLRAPPELARLESPRAAYAGVRQTSEMLTWLMDLVRPIRIVDPQFGSMRYLRKGRQWEAEVDLGAAGRVELILAGSEDGPTADQRDFVRLLAERPDELLASIEPLLRQEFADSVSSSPAVEFILTGIVLPTRVTTDADWEVHLESAPTEAWFVVRMHGWKPEDVLIEC